MCLRVRVCELARACTHTASASKRARATCLHNNISKRDTVLQNKMNTLPLNHQRREHERQKDVTCKSLTPPGGMTVTVRQAGQARDGLEPANFSTHLWQNVWKHGSSLGLRYRSRHTLHVNTPISDCLRPAADFLLAILEMNAHHRDFAQACDFGIEAVQAGNEGISIQLFEDYEYISGILKHT